MCVRVCVCVCVPKLTYMLCVHIYTLKCVSAGDYGATACTFPEYVPTCVFVGARVLGVLSLAESLGLSKQS